MSVSQGAREAVFGDEDTFPVAGVLMQVAEFRCVIVWFQGAGIHRNNMRQVRYIIKKVITALLILQLRKLVVF